MLTFSKGGAGRGTRDLEHEDGSMNHPAPVEIIYESMCFPITHNPTNETLKKFIEDWPFDDGAPPPSDIVDDWLNLLKTKFCDEPGCCVVVHCVAGLGRKRRGAFNSNQLLYLEKYQPKMQSEKLAATASCSNGRPSMKSF